MKKLYFITLLLLVSSASGFAGKDNLCSWTAITTKTQLSPRWDVGTYNEGRFNDSGFDQMFFRQYAAYKPCRGLQLKMNTDIAFVSSGFSLRFIPEAMYTYKSGDWSLSLRQRILWSWKKPTDKWSMWYRTRGMVTYRIPGTSVSPLLAVEPFYRDILGRVRYYAGFKVPASENASLMIQYMRQDFTGGRADDNVFWVTWSVNLF